MKFSEWLFSEMAARRSLSRVLDKYGAAAKPTATLTAWRATLFGKNGPVSERERLRLNRAANRALMMNLSRRGLSYQPVIGAGQEADERGVVTANREDSFIVQPVGDMKPDVFLNHVREILYNPTGEEGLGPHPHTQYGAAVNLPDTGNFILSHTGASPAGPADYTKINRLGGRAAPRLSKQPFFSQMPAGPRASSEMGDEFDGPSEKPGRRYSIE